MSIKNRLAKLEKSLPERVTAHLVFEVLAEYISDDEFQTLVQAAVIVERVWSPGILNPIVGSGEWELVEKAANILQRVDQHCKSAGVFKEIQIDVDMGKLSDLQLERLRNGASFFKILLDERNRKK